MKVKKRFAALLAATFLSVPAALPALAQAGAELSAADFAQLPVIARPSISPDGTKIAALYVLDGAQYLTIAPIDGGKPKVIGTGDNDLNWWRWVNNDWLVVGIGDSRPFGRFGEAYIRRAVGVKADGTQTVPLGDRKRDLGQTGDRLLWVASDGSPHVMLAAQHDIFSDHIDFWPSVVDVDVSTGRERVIATPHRGVMNWIVDHRGVVRVGIGHSNDGRHRQVIYRTTNDERFRTIDRSATDEDDARDTPDIFLPDGSALTLAEDEAGTIAVYRYDLTKFAKGEKVFSTPGYDVEGVAINGVSGALDGYVTLEKQERSHWVSADMVALQQEIDAKIQHARADILSLDDRHDRAIIYVSAPDGPGAYFVYDRPTQGMISIGLVNPKIGLHRLNPVRSIRYKSRDGLEIEAVLTLPKGKEKALPLIVLPHGGPSARDDESWDFWTQFLASRGYAVVQPNYRGSSGYGTKLADAGQGEWGGKMQDDLVDAITYLADQGIADPGRVCIAGASYGGYAAIRAAERDASHYRCAISYAGVSDLKALIGYNNNFLFSGSRKDWLTEQAPDLKSVSPINSPQDIALPLLLVHGKKDLVVPFDQSHDMAEKLEKLGKPVQFIEQPDADHHFSRMEDRLEFLNAMEAFLKKYNPA
ncbi:MAG: S9 family peptidase [Sphingomonas sp.]|nr:S9 family peptidase [Sphingomonas sp.]